MYKNGNNFYVMVKPVGSWDRDGCRHYALWQKVWKRWFPFPVGKEFWLDTAGFKKC